MHPLCNVLTLADMRALTPFTQSYFYSGQMPSDTHHCKPSLSFTHARSGSLALPVRIDRNHKLDTTCLSRSELGGEAGFCTRRKFPLLPPSQRRRPTAACLAALQLQLGLSSLSGRRKCAHWLVLQRKTVSRSLRSLQRKWRSHNTVLT